MTGVVLPPLVQAHSVFASASALVAFWVVETSLTA